MSLKRLSVNLLQIAAGLYLSSAVCAVTSAASATRNYTKTLPAFSLKDPTDKTYTAKMLASKGVVLVVTAPIQANESSQKGWDEQLRQAKQGNAGHLVFLQDMTPSSFKSIAISQMKKEYKPGVEPILLLDHDGRVRKSLKVTEKSTVVLVYNTKRRLVYTETGPPSAPAAKKAWDSLK